MAVKGIQASSFGSGALLLATQTGTTRFVDVLTDALWTMHVFREIQGAVQSQSRRLTDVPEDCSQCSMEYGEPHGALKPVPELSAQSYADSGSAASSTHTFCAAAHPRALPAVTSGPKPGRSPAAAVVPAAAAQMLLHSAAGAGDEPAVDAVAAMQQHPQQQCGPPIRHTFGAPRAAALLAGALEAGVA